MATGEILAGRFSRCNAAIQEQFRGRHVSGTRGREKCQERSRSALFSREIHGISRKAVCTSKNPHSVLPSGFSSVSKHFYARKIAAPTESATPEGTPHGLYRTSCCRLLSHDSRIAYNSPSLAETVKPAAARGPAVYTCPRRRRRTQSQ